MHATTKYNFNNNTVCLYALYDFSNSKTSEYSKILKRKINHLFAIKHSTASEKSILNRQTRIVLLS